MAEPFLAEMKIFGFTFPPRGWAMCDGQILPINQNQSLYSLLGTTYGGDGRTTFGLPEMRGRVPMHSDDDHTLGQKSGEENHTLSASEIPGHTHTARASTDSADETSPQNGMLPTTEINAYTIPNDTSPLVNMGATTANAGGGQGHNNMQPFLTLNFCIALRGSFPSRN